MENDENEKKKKFQSTPSVGRATRKTMKNCIFGSFQSTPSVGRATETWTGVPTLRFISIHALRGEGDYKFFDSWERPDLISIHALRGEGDFLTI